MQYNEELHYVEPCLNGTLIQADVTNKDVRIYSLEPHCFLVCQEGHLEVAKINDTDLTKLWKIMQTFFVLTLSFINVWSVNLSDKNIF